MGFTPDSRRLSRPVGKKTSKFYGSSCLENGGCDSHQAKKKESPEPRVPSVCPMALLSPITHTTDQGDAATAQGLLMHCLSPGCLACVGGRPSRQIEAPMAERSSSSLVAPWR